MRLVALLLVVATAACTDRREAPAARVAAPPVAPAPPRPTFATADPATAQPAPVIRADAVGATAAPTVRPLTKDVLLVGEVRADLAAARVEVPARLALDTGILEFALVTTTGKAYESALVTDVRPFDVQLALLLAGFAPGETVRLRVRREGGTEEQPLAALFRDRASGQPAADDVWRFVGGAVDKGRFLADFTGTIATLVPESSAVLVAATERGNPYRGKEGFELATPLPVARGSKVTLVITHEEPRTR